MNATLEHDFRFEAAHWLPRVPEGHRCRRMHGHSYLVTLVVRGPVDPESGWVMDYAEIDAAMNPLIAELDHRVLNEVEGLSNPTSEVIAGWFWRRLEPRLRGLAQIRIHETHDTRCSYATD